MMVVDKAQIISDFKARYPEFDSAVVDARMPFMIDDYPLYFGRPYNDCNKPIILTLLAHLLYIDTRAGVSGGDAGGVVQSKSVGSVSKSYAAKNSTSTLWDFFGGTKYGQAFIQMTSRIAGGRFV